MRSPHVLITHAPMQMLYDGVPVELTPEQEEVATFFAVMKDTGARCAALRRAALRCAVLRCAAPCCAARLAVCVLSLLLRGGWLVSERSNEGHGLAGRCGWPVPVPVSVAAGVGGGGREREAEEGAKEGRA